VGNKLTLNAGWDKALLAEELSCMPEMDIDFDLGVTGFRFPEIDSLLEEVEPEEPGYPVDRYRGDKRANARSTRRYLTVWPLSPSV